MLTSILSGDSGTPTNTPNLLIYKYYSSLITDRVSFTLYSQITTPSCKEEIEFLSPWNSRSVLGESIRTR